MPRLYSSKKVVKAFKRAGFSKISQKGSHIKMRGIWNEKVRTVIIPDHKEIAFGTFQSVLNQADMSLEEFKKFL